MRKAMTILPVQPEARQIHWPSLANRLYKKAQSDFSQNMCLLLNRKINSKFKDYLLYHRIL